MISPYTIGVIARLETRTLLRSWFFRIIIVGSLVYFGFFDYFIIVSSGESDWEFRAIPSTIPYVNILFLNTVQAVVALFLATDFLKRDKKLDTTDVIYMRSMTNGDYVAGKAIGILLVFGIVNLVALVMALICNLLATDAAVVWPAYLLYPLLISLPTLVFILGLAFLFMTIFRNQAVTFLVLLGYIATTIFYLGRKFHYLFDYLAYQLPALHSGFTGFGDLTGMLAHRGMYLLLGVSFVYLTIFLLRRLEQSRLVAAGSLLMAVATGGGGIGLGYFYLQSIARDAERRTAITELAGTWIDEPLVTPQGYSLTLRHEGRQIVVWARCAVRNDTGAPLSRYLFNLNPGLAVAAVVGVDDEGGEGGGMDFRRDRQLLWIEPANALQPGAADTFDVSYSGRIAEWACYPDIDEHVREVAYRPAAIFTGEKRFAFVEPEYVLLTPETVWYPVPGPGYSPLRPVSHATRFCDFDLTVQTDDSLTAVAQGAAQQPEPGRFLFTPETPLPAMTVAIGSYEVKSVAVDSVVYSIYHRPGHDYFSTHFADLGDTLQAMIREVRQDFENKIGLEYRFPRLSLVEVPIHFFSFQRTWTVNQEVVQPELVLFPEKGLSADGTDFTRMARRIERRNNRRNQDLTPAENQCRMFERFVRSTLVEDFTPSRYWWDDDFEFETSYNLMPNYLSFVNHLASDRLPIVNLALESYFVSRLEDRSTEYFRFSVGLVPSERANLLLDGRNLPDVLADRESRDLLPLVLKAKGDYLFLLLEGVFGEEIFQEFLIERLAANRFRDYPLENFLTDLEGHFGVDFRPYLDNWYHGRELPGFLTSNFECYKIIDGDRERYQVRLRIGNPEAVDGVVKLSFRKEGNNRGRRGGGRGRQEVDPRDAGKLVFVAAGQLKEVGQVLDFQPSSVRVVTFVARNIPTTIFHTVTDCDLRKGAEAFDGELVLDGPLRWSEDGEIIVDNEDAGFASESSSARCLLRKWFPKQAGSDETKYVGMRFWRDVNSWLPTINPHFYGKYIKSAHYTNETNGKRYASWTTEIPLSGYYDIYCHVYKRKFWWHGGDDRLGENHFRIQHEDGVEEVDLDLENAENGWNYLGSYYLAAGDSRVAISNETRQNFVVADAVKWIKR